MSLRSFEEKVRELEARIKELETERDTLKNRLREMEAQAAVMRSALEDVDAVHRSAAGEANERGDNLPIGELWRRVRNALSLSAGAELAKKVERLEARVEAMTKTLMLCSLLFGDIRDDWTDPRAKCRKGQQVIETVLSSSSQEVSACDDLQGLRQAN
ncbi:MAG: hypothetical protein AB1563_00175 [Bacillota bacterium]